MSRTPTPFHMELLVLTKLLEMFKLVILKGYILVMLSLFSGNLAVNALVYARNIVTSSATATKVFSTRPFPTTLDTPCLTYVEITEENHELLTATETA